MPCEQSIAATPRAGCRPLRAWGASPPEVLSEARTLGQDGQGEGGNPRWVCGAQGPSCPDARASPLGETGKVNHGQSLPKQLRLKMARGP